MYANSNDFDAYWWVILPQDFGGQVKEVCRVSVEALKVCAMNG